MVNKTLVYKQKVEDDFYQAENINKTFLNILNTVYKSKWI